MSWGTGSIRHVLVAMLSLAAPMAAAAQITTGTVVGTVQDAQGGVVPGVTVVLVSQTRGTKMVPVVTGAQGNFVVPNVTPDAYTVEVTMAGFKTISRANVAVSGGDRVTVPTFTLEVGGATETITVTGSAPLIQAQSGERSYAVTAEQVANLPFADRGFAALAALAPG